MRAILGFLQGAAGREGFPPGGVTRSASALLLASAMHAIFFGLKRAWHGCLRTTRHALATLGLTAARFDLLYVLHKQGELPITQRKLRVMLGVNRTTVSRMLGSLEALGLLSRTRSDLDRRTRVVRLTERGDRCMRVAVRGLIRSGAAQLAVDTAIAGAPNAKCGPSWHDGYACLLASDVLESLLWGMRRAYGDFAGVHYPWHPDD